MKLVPIKLDIPDGYITVQTPKEWTPDDYLTFTIPKASNNKWMSNDGYEITDSLLNQVSNHTVVTSWLLEQSSRLRGCSRFLLGLQLNKKGQIFDKVDLQHDENHVQVKIYYTQIIAYYPSNPSKVV